jgi:hypothetical protein
MQKMFPNPICPFTSLLQSNSFHEENLWAGISYWVQWLITGWTAQESDPSGGNISRNRPEYL